MREGLAREFPGAVRAAAWTRARVRRRLVLRNEPVPWGTISGIGAGFLVSAVVQAAVALAGDAFQALRTPMPFSLFPLVTLAGSAAAAAVALGGGGLIALALYLAYIGLGVMSGIPSTMAFCQRIGGQLGLADLDRCTVVGFVAALWPQVVGIGLGVLIVRAITTNGSGINSVLRVSGSFAIALFLLRLAWAAMAAQTTNAMSTGLTIAAGIVAAAVAAGVVAGQLPRGIRSAAIVAGVWLLQWVTLEIPLLVQNLGPTVPAENAGPILVGLAAQPTAAMFLVLSAAVASRARFIPSSPA